MMPSSFYRYLPCANYEERDCLRVLGVVSTEELADDSELFVDYFDVFVFDSSKVPEWLSLTLPETNPLLLKDKLERKLPLFGEMMRYSTMPDKILNRFDLDLMIQAKMEITPSALLRQNEQIRIEIEQSKTQKTLEEKAPSRRLEGDEPSDHIRRR